MEIEKAQTGEDSNLPDWRVPAGIVVLGLVLFAGSLNDGFHFDDDLILADSNVTNAARWHHFLNPFHLRQLTFFTFYINHLIGGEDPVGYHVVNVVLHLGNAYLFYRLLLPLLGAWTALAASLIFLAHPIQTESVLYIYQRSTLLATFFSLLGLTAVRRLALEPKTVTGSRRWPGMAMAFVWFALAFESKESALAVPLVLLMFVGVRTPMGRAVGALVGTFGFAALGLLFLLGEETVGFGAVRQVHPFFYSLTQVRVLYTYLRLLVVPYPQSLEYDFRLIQSPFDPIVILGLAGLVFLLFGARWLFRHPRFHWAGVGAGSFFILLLPTSSIIPSRDFAFEHRLYLPMLGFSLLVSFLVAGWRRRTVCLGLILVAFSVLTIDRGRVWASDVRLWQDATENAPGKARAWFNLGGAQLDSAPDRARVAFEQAIRLQPEFPEAFYNLGVIEQGRGDNIAALGWYQRSVDQAPEYWPAINNMGNVRFSLGDHPGAITDFNRTLELNPEYWPAEYNLAIVYTAMARPADAVPKLRIVLDWSPDFREARYLLAVSLERLGRGREADEEFRKLSDSPTSEMDLVPLPAVN